MCYRQLFYLFSVTYNVLEIKSNDQQYNLLQNLKFNA